MAIVDVLQAGGLLELGKLEPGDEGAIFFPDPLAFHQHRQAFVEAQVTALRLLLLFLPGLGQAVEFHGVEFFEGRFGQHGLISQVEGGGVSYSIPGARAAGMSSAQRR